MKFPIFKMTMMALVMFSTLSCLRMKEFMSDEGECVNDCPEKPSELQVALNRTNRPFGFHHAPFLELESENLGIQIIRLVVAWDAVQPKADLSFIQDRRFNWEFLENMWKIDQYENHNIDFMITITPAGVTSRIGQFSFDNGPYNYDSYSYYVEEVVKKYRQRGVIYFQIGNEPVDPEVNNYVKQVQLTSSAIRRVCKDCKIVLGGIDGVTASDAKAFDKHMLPVLQQIDPKDIDIIDLHWFGEAQDYSPHSGLSYFKKRLKENNFNTEDLEFWITEMGTYSGQIPLGGGLSKGINPLTNQPYPPQSEADQAASLVKRYITSLALGVNKIFWAYGLVEGFKFDSGYFDFTGLIYDGDKDPRGVTYTWGQAPFSDPGFGVKKMSYFSMKLLIEKLGNADFSTLETLSSNGGLHIYRLMNEGRAHWILWSDEPLLFTLKGVNSRQVRQMQMVGPPETKIVDTINDSVTLALEPLPIILDEM